jgi:hypothetical protein
MMPIGLKCAGNPIIFETLLPDNQTLCEDIKRGNECILDQMPIKAL